MAASRSTGRVAFPARLIAVAGLVTWPPGPLAGLPVIALVGGLLAISINNLPAAAFGAIWLSGAAPVAIVAFLIGTNLVAIATPHGSLATILSRQLRLRGGVGLGARTYLRAAWRYALVSSAVAVVTLVIVG